MKTHTSWTELKRRLHVNQKIKGTVIESHPFGIILDINEYFHGIVTVPYLGDNHSLDVENYPGIGTEVIGTIIGFREPLDESRSVVDNQVWISLRQDRG